jgi:polysaccharide biosynthesis/export protein ExoF
MVCSPRLLRSEGLPVAQSARQTLGESSLLRWLACWTLIQCAVFCFPIVSHFAQARLLDGPRRSSGVLQEGGADATKGDAGDISSASLAVVKDAGPQALAFGDRLKITFFESLGVALDHSGTSSDQVLAVFPRMDLSGEYTVDDGGNLDIPKLGLFITAGRSILALQSELASAFRRALGRSTDVHVAVIERQPIFVLGTVRNSGAFKYTPGMIVLQAFAQAGTAGPGTTDTSKAIELVRETERLSQTVDRLNRLRVKHARLVAQRENSANLTLPASIESQISETTSLERLGAMVQGETATLIAERNRFHRQLSLAEQQVSIARVEIDAHNKRGDQLKVLLSKKTDRLHELEKVAARGNLSQNIIGNLDMEIADLIARQQDQLVALAQAKRRLVEAEILQSTIELDQSVGLERDQIVTLQDIEDCKQQIASMQAVIQVLRSGLSEVESVSVPSFRIIRKTAGDHRTIAATETTLLQPGDVLQVALTNRSNTWSSETATAMQRPITSRFTAP